MVAGAATAVAGAVLAFGIQPSTDISDDMWRYPWSSSGAFVAFSVFSACSTAGRRRHLRLRPQRRRRTITSRTVGVALAVAGTALLLVGELASIPIRNAQVDDTSAVIVGAHLRCRQHRVDRRVPARRVGNAASRRLARLASLHAARHRHLADRPDTGRPRCAEALHGGVGVYGLCLLAMAIALHTEPGRP